LDAACREIVPGRTFPFDWCGHWSTPSRGPIRRSSRRSPAILVALASGGHYTMVSACLPMVERSTAGLGLDRLMTFFITITVGEGERRSAAFPFPPREISACRR